MKWNLFLKNRAIENENKNTHVLTFIERYFLFCTGSCHDCHIISAKMLPKIEPKPANNGQTVRIDSDQQAGDSGGLGCCSKN